MYDELWTAKYHPLKIANIEVIVIVVCHEITSNMNQLFTLVYVIVIAWGQGFMVVNRPESEGGLLCHKSLATVL